MSEVTERLREAAGFLRGLTEGRGGDLRPRAKQQGRKYAADLEMIAAFYEEADKRAIPVQSPAPSTSDDPRHISNDPLASSP